jgi:hypothetical protein
MTKDDLEVAVVGGKRRGGGVPGRVGDLNRPAILARMRERR